MCADAISSREPVILVIINMCNINKFFHRLKILLTMSIFTFHGFSTLRIRATANENGNFTLLLGEFRMGSTTRYENLDRTCRVSNLTTYILSPAPACILYSEMSLLSNNKAPAVPAAYFVAVINNERTFLWRNTFNYSSFALDSFPRN